MTRKKLLDVYPKPLIQGIFTAMYGVDKFKELFANVDLTTEDDFHAMDMDYLLNHSGLKTVSVLLEYIISGYVIDDDSEYATLVDGRRVTWDYVMQVVDQDIIDTIIDKKFYTKWSKLIETINYDYDPLSPFEMNVEETSTDNLSSTGTDKNSRDITTSDKGNNSSSIENVDVGNDNMFKYGFNSTSSVPSDSKSTSNTFNSSNSNEYSNSQTASNAFNSNQEYTRDSTGSRTTTRTGNIGNITKQALINEQRELLKYQLFDTIYQDLDSVLTRSKYIN